MRGRRRAIMPGNWIRVKADTEPIMSVPAINCAETKTEKQPHAQ
jgi:hypothetical protein